MYWMMKECLLVVALLGVGFIGFAQKYTTKDNASDKIKKLYQRAVHYSNSAQYEDAEKELNEILKLDSNFIDGYIQRGNIKYDQEVYAEAEGDFKKALSIDPKYFARLPYQLGLTLLNQNKYEEAATYFEQYLQSGVKNEEMRRRAQKHAANARFAVDAYKNPVPFEPKKLSANINTLNPQYLPSLTADGQFLVYTAVIGGQEDFYFSQLTDGEWQKGQPLEAINTELNEGAQNISADGKLLVFTACTRPEGMGSCDLYFAESHRGKWTKPKNIGPPINSSAWESQPSLSADGKALYFASNRGGTLGGNDLWVSYRQANGSWGKPENLGNIINTPEDDQAPFMHPDGQTLYFMSIGHPGMGGFDLYFAKRKPDGTWDKPQNLGYPINTRANEGALVVSLDGTTAYFASDDTEQHKDQPGLLVRRNADIFSFTLPKEARPNPVTYVKAKIFDDNTKAPLAAKVEFIDLKSEQIFTSSITDVDGEFLVCLPLGKDYALNVSKEKYLFHSENFNLAEQKTLTQPYLLEIGLIPIPEEKLGTAKTKPVILKNVFFETGSAALRPESKDELNRLKRLLTENPKLKIRINGHTDNVGADKDNLTLSEKRAKAVYDFLVQQNIASERLQFKGFGETQPIDKNDTPIGRQNNRRTEFEVIQ